MNSSRERDHIPRIIARMDIKGANLIKSVRLEGLRVLGQPNEFALDYYKQGIDELIYMDCVASLYGRNSLSSLVSTAIENIFVPLTVGGGIRSIDDVFELLRAGADKVALNTAVVNDPQLITQIVNKFGSQCLVLSIDAKLNSKGKWEVLTESGRERTGLDALDWAIKGTELGVGEILLTSVDREGTRQGFDVELIRSISESVSVPVIASGGLRTAQDFVSVIEETSVDAVAIADAFHYRRLNVNDIREAAKSHGIRVRNYDSK